MKYINRVDAIKPNRYMGNEYVEYRGKTEIGFLFGKTLNRIAPNLILEIGNKVEIEIDENGFVIGIRKIS